MDVQWEYVGYDAELTAELIAEIQAEMTARYGGPDRTPVDPTEFAYRALVLETGLGQPEAIALYESAGHEPVPAFGYYADSPLSRAYGKTL